MRIITLIAAVTAWAAAAWAEPTAQIRKQTVHIDVISQSEYRMTEHTEVVIYKETMSQLANFYTTLDKSEKIERFACVVEGVNSKFNKKYKVGDLKYSEYSGDMVTDLKSVELSIDLPLYPIVVTTDVTYHRTDNTISYPPFLPIPAYDTEVKEATYMIDFPASMNLRYVAMDTDMKPVESTTPKEKKRWTFTLANQGEVVYEEFSKPLLQQIPKVLFVPEKLDYYGTQGSMKSWEEFGLWINSLCQGMDVLPDDARAKVHELTDTCATDWDKVRVLYNLLRRHTRYVSIQLGIGGYRPLAAEFVWRKGFGDCKALTNLMKAMLAEAGVASTYTLISTWDLKINAKVYINGTEYEFGTTNPVKVTVEHQATKVVITADCTAATEYIQALRKEYGDGVTVEVHTYGKGLTDAQLWEKLKKATVRVEPSGYKFLKYKGATSAYFTK